MSLARDLLAGPGNQHWDLGRIASAWGFILYTGAAIWDGISAGRFDLVALAGGYAALLVGSGGLIALKDGAAARRAAEAAGE